LGKENKKRKGPWEGKIKGSKDHGKGELNAQRTMGMEIE
jgi:hypothetical protein